MLRLIECNKCGGQVSTSATICPHCNRDPHYRAPKLCWFCKQPSDESNSRDVFGGTRIHNACLASFKERTLDINQFTCPDCKKRHFYNTFSRGKSKCPKCGYPFEFDTCEFCWELALSALPSVINGYDDSGGSWTTYHHVTCGKTYKRILDHTRK
jgi:predicted amidophosphoribosyltransferase